MRASDIDNTWSKERERDRDREEEEKGSERDKERDIERKDKLAISIQSLYICHSHSVSLGPSSLSMVESASL